MPKITAPVADLYATAEKAKRWFLARACSRSPGDWNKQDGLSDSGDGAVYAFFGRNGSTLYVGQTGVRLKKRATFQTSRHYDTVWWNKWTTLRFLNIDVETDRLALELLLILALAPKHNVKPRFRPLAKMREGLTLVRAGAHKAARRSTKLQGREASRAGHASNAARRLAPRLATVF